ncbi:MAG: hypothetical protein MZV49_19775 [Rhodopseudomonas palustris]|nr:hypothetical protein [Rhodopseudomonas palustris]
MQEVEKLKVLQSETGSTQIADESRKRHEKKAENHTETVCPECGGRQLVHDYERAELVCQGCGLVIDDDFIDRGPEWRAFDHDQRMKRSRVGAPMTFTIHDKGLSTMIDWRNRDSLRQGNLVQEPCPGSTVSANGSAVSGSAMQPSATLRLPFQNLTAWHLLSAFRETSVRLQQLFTVMRLTRT